MGEGRTSTLSGARGVPITPRERQLLSLLADGSPNNEIAERIGVRETTVAKQFERLQSKTGTQSRLELVIYALRNGIVL